MTAIFLIIGLVVGFAVGWLVANLRSFRQTQAEREQRVAAETRSEEIAKQLEAQKSLVEEARAQLSDTFKALSSDALRANSQAFVERTNQALAPLQEALRRYEEHVRELEHTRQRDYGRLEEQLGGLERETSTLARALQQPQVRGRWGELTLHRAVELAGMVEHCDFSEQVSVAAEGGRLRPDMIVHLPGGREVVVDSKVPLDAYLSAVEAQDEEARKACLSRHCQQIRQHMNALSGKAYWDQFPSAPEFVVMFVPGESFLSVAAAEDPALIEHGMQKRVFPATPITLVALLRTVAHGWRQEQIARSAQEVSDLGRTLYDRLRVFAEHMSELGKQLGSAAEAYNRAVGSLEARVLPSARRFRELGAGTSAEITALDPVDTRARQLSAPEAAEETSGSSET